ncbi:diguanylate cyclase response regulator [Anaerocolumna cellulosilytica]|uniref:Stage 0 sporulation protein A homolog n=1 Tax=Anaerocolumna cellulosilytica TaxID=433286 RepID=A0A6S6R9W7_9FIRM|nr:diguanylate cyclase [Anaerocolumna cellulosilytica]MBB5196550.1 diguanylate cyclase (GGDEF)-like protein [Anaerocolumna cellulosilytica]BCJ95651.1 diguanylate cyclase response regulator [Anaerocolumna cellulosilytica]
MDKDIVLVVDDSEIICSIIKDILETPTLHIAIAHSGEESIVIAKQLRPTLILLDIIMNGIDGYETCRILKEDKETMDIPVIFITGNNDSDSVLRGFEVGAADYVSKPFIPEELKARVKVHMQNVKNQRELQILMQELKEMAITDYLTKVYNRRYFMDQLQLYVTQDMKNLSLILFDVDNFKKINDSYGHNTGDFVLVTISNIFRLLLREEDILSRWGGEEFMICLPDTDIPEAVFLANKLRNEVSKYYFRCDEFEFHCTVTGGVVLYDWEKTTEKNITEADQALYLGKSSGKNCCVSNYEVTG